MDILGLGSRVWGLRFVGDPPNKMLAGCTSCQRLGLGFGFQGQGLQGYLAHKKQPPPRTLPEAWAQGPTVSLGEGAVSDERGTHA